MNDKYEWQDNIYYIKASGAVVGNVALKDGTWHAYVRDVLNWKYVSKDFAMAGVERVIDMEDKVCANSISFELKEIKELRENKQKWWKIW